MSEKSGGKQRTAPLTTWIRRWQAPLSLALFQVAPISVQQTPDGRLEFGIGVGADSYMQELLSCEGTTLSERPASTRVASATVRYLRNDMTWSAFGGVASATAGECRSLVSGANCPPERPFAGPFGGSMFTYSARSFALGIGLVTLRETSYAAPDYPPSDGTTMTFLPTGHVRVGDRQGMHLLAEGYNVATPGQTPMARLGMGLGRDDGRFERGFVGFGLLPRPGMEYDVTRVVTGTASFPLRSMGEVMVGAYLGENRMRGISLGVRAGRDVR